MFATIQDLIRSNKLFSSSTPLSKKQRKYWNYIIKGQSFDTEQQGLGIKLKDTNIWVIDIDYLPDGKIETLFQTFPFLSKAPYTLSNYKQLPHFYVKLKSDKLLSNNIYLGNQYKGIIFDILNVFVNQNKEKILNNWQGEIPEVQFDDKYLNYKTVIQANELIQINASQDFNKYGSSTNDWPPPSSPPKLK